MYQLLCSIVCDDYDFAELLGMIGHHFRETIGAIAPYL